MGQRGSPQLPFTRQIWGRGWRGRKMPLGARTLCLGTPGCGGSGVTHSVPLLSWLLDALSWWSPWSYRSRGTRQPVAALGQQRGQAWWQVVAEGHLSPLLWTPCTPTQDITGSPGGPGCPGRPCGDKSSDQHPLRAVTGRIWGHEAPPQLQGGTPKHLPPLQGPLYRPARGQSKGVRGCTPLPAPCVGKTRSPRCPLSPPLARGRSPWGTPRRRALAPAPAGETRGGRINPGRENPKTTPPMGAAPPGGCPTPHPGGDDGAEVVGELPLQLLQRATAGEDEAGVLGRHHVPQLLPVRPLQAHRQHPHPCASSTLSAPTGAPWGSSSRGDPVLRAPRPPHPQP